MMNVLDALRYRLSGPAMDLEGETIDPSLLEAMGRGGLMGTLGSLAPSRLPLGLPLGVQDSILNRPSYGEGEVLAPDRWHNPVFGVEPWVPEGSGREQRLVDELNFNRYLKSEGGGAWPEAQTGFMRSREADQSPFASPLNQLLQRRGSQRGPLALY